MIAELKLKHESELENLNLKRKWDQKVKRYLIFGVSFTGLAVIMLIVIACVTSNKNASSTL